MDREYIYEYLQSKIDLKYKDFHTALVPGMGDMMGVRIPEIKLLAKEIAKENCDDYFSIDYTKTYEEKQLHGLVIGYTKGISIEKHIELINEFVPKIDNWAICDSFCASLKFTKKNMERITTLIEKYLNSKNEFESRFAVVMLLDHYITDTYIDYAIDKLTKVDTSKYYVMMAVAWAISVCYIKYPKKTIKVIEESILDRVTHNKAIRKMVESLRVSDEDKNTLRLLKR